MKMLPADCAGFTPTPSFVIIALVAAGTLNSSAANFNTAVNGVASGTLNLNSNDVKSCSTDPKNFKTATQFWLLTSIWNYLGALVLIYDFRLYMRRNVNILSLKFFFYVA